MSSDFELVRQPASTEIIKIIKARFIFLTQEDAKVDPEICEPLNRTVYDSDDPDIPSPPLHRHCRCRLIPLMEEEDPFLASLDISES